MIDPIKHPKRYAAERDRQLAARARVLAPAMPLSSLAAQLGISKDNTEKLCARHQIAYRVGREDKL